MGTEIVVVGGGYTGVWAARRILRGLRRTAAGAETRVTVVSTSTTHAFHGWTAERIGVGGGLVDRAAHPERHRR